MNTTVASQVGATKIKVTKKKRVQTDAQVTVETIDAVIQKDDTLRIQAETGVEISVAIEVDACAPRPNKAASEPDATVNAVFNIEQVGNNLFIKIGNERLLEIVNFYQTPGATLGEIAWQYGEVCAPLGQPESTNWWPALLLLGLRGGGGGGGTSVPPVHPNTVPVLVAAQPNQRVVEAGGLNNTTLGQPAATVQLTKTDPDVGDAVSYDANWLLSQAWSTNDGGLSYTKTGIYGKATLTLSTNVVSYQLNDLDPDTQSLVQGQSVQDKFLVQVTDSHGATAQASVNFDIDGVDDVLASKVAFVTSNAPLVGAVPTLNIGDGAIGAAGNVVFTIGFEKALSSFTPLDANGSNFEFITSAGTVLRAGVDFLAQVTLDSADATGKTYKLEIALLTEIDDAGFNIRFLADPDGNGQAVQDEQGVNTVDQLLLTNINIDSNPTTGAFKLKVDTQAPSMAVFLADAGADHILSGVTQGVGLVNAAEKADTAATFTVTHEADATQVQFFSTDGAILLATANAANGWGITLNLAALDVNPDPNTGAGSYQFVTRQTDDANNVAVNSYTLDFDVFANAALVNSYVPTTLTTSDFNGPAGSEVFTLSGSAQESGTVTVSWDSQNNGIAQLIRSFQVTQADIGTHAWSIDFAKSDLVPYVTPPATSTGAFHVSFTDTAGNTVATNQIQHLLTQLVLP